MENVKKGFVQIPTNTLNALKNMLFSNEGVDLTNIINDITINEDAHDLMAINVALVYKGVKIDIDKTTRYELLWTNKIAKHEFKGYSLIHEAVKVQTYDCHIDENGNIVEDKKRDKIAAYSFDQWSEWTTNVATLIDKIKK